MDPIIIWIDNLLTAFLWNMSNSALILIIIKLLSKLMPNSKLMPRSKQPQLLALTLLLYNLTFLKGQL
jgi:hypothetical protein